MADGLKQGSPLSPLFFILAIDPLLTQLNLIRGADSKCFADDLAIGFARWSVLLPCFHLIDAWSTTVGCAVNFDKTKFISTSANPPRNMHHFPGSWQRLEVVQSYVYLGILFGRSVDVNMAFEAPLGKFKQRLESYMANKSQYCLSGRIHIANTYLLPIFSYVCRFFLMSL